MNNINLLNSGNVSVNSGGGGGGGGSVDSVSGNIVSNTDPANPVVTQVQADWTQADNAEPDFIKNKPTLGTGDVVGPDSATNNAIPRYDTTTGKLIKNSDCTIDDSGNLTANVLTGRGSVNVGLGGPAFVRINSDDTLSSLKIDIEDSAGEAETNLRAPAQLENVTFNLPSLPSGVTNVTLALEEGMLPTINPQTGTTYTFDANDFAGNWVTANNPASQIYTLPAISGFGEGDNCTLINIGSGPVNTSISVVNLFKNPAGILIKEELPLKTIPGFPACKLVVNIGCAPLVNCVALVLLPDLS